MTDIRSTVTIGRDHYDALIRERQTLATKVAADAVAVAWHCIYPAYGHFTLKESEADQAKANGAEVRPLIYAYASNVRKRAGHGTYDPTTQPFDEPFQHVDRPNEFRRGFLDGIRIASEEANGVDPILLKGMSDRYVSIYCAARRDASDLIKVIPYMHCEYCDAGKRTGLASNACENCMNTGLKYPEFAK